MLSRRASSNVKRSPFSRATSSTWQRAVSDWVSLFSGLHYISLFSRAAGACRMMAGHGLAGAVVFINVRAAKASSEYAPLVQGWFSALEDRPQLCLLSSCRLNAVELHGCWCSHGAS